MKSQNRKKLIRAVGLLFYLYIILLCYFLFFSEHYGRENILTQYRYNLEPFKEIKRFIKYREQLGLESFIVNILGNILAFMPLGFLYPILDNRKRGFLKILWISLFFSLSVESVQLLFKVGIFDVDDIILNTCGGLFGYILYLICCTIISKLFPRKRQGRT